MAVRGKPHQPPGDFMKKTAFLAIAATVIIGSFLASRGSHAEQGDKLAPNSHFKDRVVVTSSKSNPGTGASLKSPVVKKLGEREFLVGAA
ncbi:MAG: hypothetical protein ACREHD_26395, partial [Pirellulales bacterium]